MRVNDRVDADGKKVLFVEEVQSDWHQAGRKKGYKGDINEVYSFVTTSLIGHPKIEIFSVICGYFDISPDKFYESLSNSFKTELITELKGRGFLSSRKSLF
jgi:hypothetical protein